MMVRDMDLFKEWLRSCGAEVLGPTSRWEVLRVRTFHGILVAHRTRRNRQVWPPDLATIALQFTRGETPALSSERRRRLRSGLRQKFPALIERDGPGCFFCGVRVPEPEEECHRDYAPSIEHLVSHAHGGPNHISNSYLAHKRCNEIAGNLSAPEKIRLRDQMRATGNAINGS